MDVLERAIAGAARRVLKLQEDPVVKVDRSTGDLRILVNGRVTEASATGRVVFEAARDVFRSKLLEIGMGKNKE